MGTVVSFENELLLEKIQVDDTTDSLPVGANAMVASGSIRLLADKVARNIRRPYLGAKPFQLVNKRVEITYEIELTPSGAAGTAPPWADSMISAGCAEVIVAATSAAYSPVSEGHTASTIYFWRNSTRYAVIGCKGTVEIAKSINNIPVLRFVKTGTFVLPNNQAQVVGDFSAFQDPVTVDQPNWAVTVNGTVNNATSLTMTGNQQVTPHEGSDEKCVVIDDRDSAFQATIYNRGLAAQDLFALADNQSNGSQAPIAITAVLGTAAGSIVELQMPTCQLEYPVETEINGADGLNLTGSALPSGAGNNEWSLIVR